MTKLVWGGSGDRRFETGVDRGVLFLIHNGQYDEAHAWNGLTAVTKTPSGAEPTSLYADNKKYLSLRSAEDFGFTIEAYSSPVAFDQCDGSASPVAGVSLGQQGRSLFGFSWRTRVGNDVDGSDFGYKIHLAYGATASPSEKAYETINESPDAITLSWEATTTPIEIDGFKPTAIVTIDSTLVSAADLANFEAVLYGTPGSNARMPLPDEVITFFNATANTLVTPAAPTFVASTGVITIPTTTGVTYRRADTNAVVTGTVTIPTAGATLGIKAVPKPGYSFPAMADTYWAFTRA